MQSVTVDQFIAEFDDLLIECAREWREQSIREPDLYPPRMTFADWWEHFSVVYIPEYLLGGHEPEERRLAPAGPRAA